MLTKPPLPSFRRMGVPRVIPRRLHLPFFILRGSSLVPASYGVFSCILSASYVNKRDASNILELRSTELDYWLGAMWCLLAGLWSYWLADGLMNRWLFYYEVGSTIFRLISLQAINWVITAFVITHYGPDEPIWSWMFCSVVLAICDVIQWLFTSTTKFQKDEDPGKIRQLIWKEIYRYIFIPLAIFTFITMICLLEEQSRFRYNPIEHTKSYKLNTNLSLSEIRPDSNVKVIMIVLSSWTESGYRKRQTFRDTSVKLIPQSSKNISITYRFVLGDAPSAKLQLSMAHKLLDESKRHGDLVIVPTSDHDDDLSHKVYKGFEWSNQYSFDYIVKTDDDIFVRMDIIARELEESGPDKKYYWRGLGYWNDGQNLGIWLFPYNIRPIHDRRIQQVDACEDDLIAKHFSDQFEEDQSMKDMYENVINHKRMCEGFRQRFCASCYPCWGREDHWKDSNFDCDDTKGITLLNQTHLILDNSVAVFDDPINVTIGSMEDEWIIPNLLSQHSSVYSQTNLWYLLHWVCWTTDQMTFLERHYKTIELIWIHTPKAIIFVLTTTLPRDFFSEYQKQGYQIHVINLDKESLLERQWFLGQNSKNWLRDWSMWETNKFFTDHLTDYMRYLLLYKYGGMFMDMDVLWIRAPSDTNIEFVGSDVSNVPSDIEWTLDADGTYVAPGVMRFRKGRSMFREIMERSFSPTYSPSCFNCVGHRAITMYVKEHRKILERHGFTILPSRILYPRNDDHVGELFRPDHTAQEGLLRIENFSWSIKLFGKMTNNQLIENDSLISLVMNKFSLDIPHSSAPLKSGGEPDLKNRVSSYPFLLEGPKKYRFVSPTISQGVDQYAGSINGQFQGLNIIFIRGGPGTVDQATIRVKSLNGKCSFNLLGGEWSETSVTIHNTTKKDVNDILNALVYRPNEVGGKDNISLEIVYGEDKAELTIDIEILVSQEYR
ncbi:4218_t:CDS:2 [Funneliformis mosseae]|uniref:4218_t:CDS:1 n=1 Tax=Funneliformis mosseae TaxID=27381 RepID=A0A9N8YS12_FUNMO|nr:4218_t:CDS:2 [Funneliformis mosseae]